MKSGSTVISYTLAALAGVCFIQGLVLLTDKGGEITYGENKEICVNS